ncbi:hypothetical protein [Stenotrophomonas sp. 17(2023)]|uniref:hypothetical protein n=1 Tax=Stenotrophomonas sp. 17(2023) TaxID=3051123 RepID=UPI001CF2289B|nr:hypothetical protein [Stenotrophomonas sp. 17(2023)]MCA7024232.1 hypothetical protein [Stenotrophomonas acidaminiphila]
MTFRATSKDERTEVSLNVELIRSVLFIVAPSHVPSFVVLLHLQKHLDELSLGTHPDKAPVNNLCKPLNCFLLTPDKAVVVAKDEVMLISLNSMSFIESPRIAQACKY